ncbi:NAD-dependent epimerase/dehydratase family protein [Pseudomonas reactans]|uniref:NAD-dependent epimerase/dehydratase family protein n=1 Tax=Pseudomonas reactans TaxID=117680 RepID=UPI0015A00889|nr:NAD(P)-dependent oxidoreductase [Pseudomonas reactans]NWC87995.1 NAD-dependent epimerase/dehydratase family protein [Pseudomonas reactans]NWD31078.1 NAD-dependent epimerase/dehydratase family protein [Pseudomonas reactans]NWF13741.1 NAD-dependent epimerase/dehydratase family protein [Pseudomonas reactans]
MKKIAILGASSQIAKDFILSTCAAKEYGLILYVRDIPRMRTWLSENALAALDVFAYESYGQQDHEVVMNFIGVGDPSKAAAMGASILDITLEYDQMVLRELSTHPTRKYLFLSSGAAYGSAFDAPAGQDSSATIPINGISAQDYYSVAKLHAEVRHRAAGSMPIVDIRVFNYFSKTQDINARFFVTDIVRAIRDDEVLCTLPGNMTRDYLHPHDFYSLVHCIIQSPSKNTAIDCYTRSPVSKYDLLNEISEKLGLRYTFIDAPSVSVSATGTKTHYYSTYYAAAEFGYKPMYSSLDTVLNESAAILGVRLDQAAKPTGQADETY